MAAVRLLQRSSVAVARSVRRGSRSTSSNRGVPEKPPTVKDLPRVGVLEMLYRMVFQGFYSRAHELQLYEKQLYGSIYIDGMKNVSLTSPKLLEQVLRSDEKFPCRGDMSIWKDYRDMKGFGYGPFTVEGEHWYKLRTVLNKRMMLPKDSARYCGILNAVVADFMARLGYVRRCSPTGDLVMDLANEFYRFSLEAIATILFETRLGALEKNIPAGTQQFIDAIAKMFSNSLAVVMLPKWSRNLLPYWGRYIDGWEGIFSFAKPLIDNKLVDIQQRIERNQNVEGEYLTYLLSNTEMDTKDVYGSIAELLLAGVDTTSNTLTWTLHLLSRHPQIQEKLHKEVSGLKTADGTPSAGDFAHLPYLRAVIKEALRMYPVVTFNARVMSEKSICVGGYHFSKNTVFTFCHYAISHDEEIFPEPFTFKPERWLRDGRERPNAFGSIPFGFGVRGCVGRRIAELEMYLVVFQIIRMFEIKPDPSVGEVKCLNRTVLIPDRLINLHFVDRGCKKTA
ncbi:sterol 26-hydroxylase, mitochondrial isoform X1 [Hippocampus zosterae]|uniref:sterol 26-hydroxylase, mitochondrial isoform X1 n=2 Tax=Hippocampus zosterae TaxID=109293 RepID=UPI00223E5BD5|nr:sterol 26-hydroxylase, mitochondrial isoform X1 [Hippocampus zosterae]